MITAMTSMQGTMHKQYGVANQDAVACKEIHHWQCAVAADGVSLKSDRTFSKSEYASKFCTKFMIEWLETCLESNMPVERAARCIALGFEACNLSWMETLTKENIPYYDCQTTLLCVLYRKGMIAYGLAGDGGILFELQSGRFAAAVTEIKTSPSVYPLCDLEHWKFGGYADRSDPVHALILATDGIFDNLLGLTVDGQTALNRGLVKEILDIRNVPRKRRNDWLHQLAGKIDSHDDKTIFVLIDGKNGRHPHSE